MSKLPVWSLLFLAFAQVASADNIYQILNVNLQMNDCASSNYCWSDPGASGGPATAWSDFSLIGQPWAFNATTGNALSWHYVFDSYYAVFGYGGVFDMDGPANLTFTGVVTSGIAEFTFNSWEVQLNYIGQWSNGLYADGIADVQIANGGVEGTASLKSQVVPEPSSLTLLGTGILGLWGRGRKLMQ